MPERSLQHREPDKKDDETLQREARAHLASEPALQMVAELIARLREIDVPWWSPLRLRDRWGAVERMRWLRERGDIRQRLTSSLSGLAPNAARRKTPDFQGALVDSVLDEGDITLRAFEEAFRPDDLAVYGPAGAYWHFFRESMPWDEDTPVHQEIMAWLLKSLLADRSPFDGIARTPILTPWDVRTAIDGRVWHTRMPLAIRVAIDDARLQQERDRPRVPFHANGDLAIGMPEIIAASIPLRDLVPVLVVAQKSMRFEPPKTGPTLETGKPDGGPEPGSRPHDVSPSTPPPPRAGGPLRGVPPQSNPPPPTAHGPLDPGLQAEPATLVPPPHVAPVTVVPVAAPTPPPSVAPPSMAPPSVAPPSIAPPPMAPPSVAPPSVAPPSVAPPSVAPPSMAPPSMAPPSMAPPSVAPPSIAPSSIAPKGLAGRGGGGPPPSPSGASEMLAMLSSLDLGDDLAMTNPHNNRTPEETAAESERLPPEGSSDGRRRGAKI